MGARIAELRHQRGYTQQRVSREHAWNPSQISRVEAGKVNFTLRTLCRVAAFLDVRPWEPTVPREQSELALEERPTMPRMPSKEERVEEAFVFQKQVGGRVRELRTLQGMTLQTLEAFTGIERPTLMKIEKGDYNVRASTVVRLAEAIGVYPHELYIPREQSGIRLKPPGRS